MKRLWPTLIALAILALSATAVFGATAGRPAFAAESSRAPKAPESAEPSREPKAAESAEATEASDPGRSAGAGHPVNHGCVVSAAAKAATPSGAKNHGKGVSAVAKDNPGHNPGGTNTCTLPTGSRAPSAP